MESVCLVTIINQGEIVKKVSKNLATVTASIGLTFGLFCAPANAATITNATATSTSEIGVTGTNATPIVVTATLMTVGTTETLIVDLPRGWSFVSPNSNNSCTGLVTHTMSGTTNCQALSFGFVVIASNVDLQAVPISVTFAANTLNVGSNREFRVTFKNDNPQPSVVFDEGVATLAGGAATPTPTPTPSAAPAKGTAAAFAALPKSSTQPKLKFDSGANGLGKSAKKSLKKVADVAKDGYGVRVTGAAGMQPGVSREAVRALARERAREIRAYLIKQGVPKEDIVIRTKVFPIGKAPATLVKVETLD
jgi:outer membrane protein OmpA-like peptidoglycan-associated protein